MTSRPAGPWRDRVTLAVIWLVTFALLTALVVTLDFRFRDPDSALYNRLSIELAHRSGTDWIVPQWWGNWNQEGRFLPHPPGLFWIGATLIRLGAPENQALAIANFGCYLLTFLLVFRIGTLVADRRVGWAMAWAVILTPISLQYLIRGNLEPALTLAVLFGIDCFLRVERSWPARIGFAAALTAAIFIKGVQGFALAGFAGIYWALWARRPAELFTLLGGVAVALAGAVAFEWRYRELTGGVGFWMANVGLQAGISVWSHALADKVYNLIWYLGRLLYFALPWSVLVVLSFWKRREDGTPRAAAAPVWRWLVGSALALVLVMAAFERKADRYIFPSYTLLAMAGGWLLVERSERVRRWLDRPSSVIALAFAANLLLATVLKLVAARAFYTKIQVWRH